MWWPADAPNCFKKEISKITSNKTDVSGNATMKVMPTLKTNDNLTEEELVPEVLVEIVPEATEEGGEIRKYSLIFRSHFGHKSVIIQCVFVSLIAGLMISIFLFQ